MKQLHRRKWVKGLYAHHFRAPSRLVLILCLAIGLLLFGGSQISITQPAATPSIQPPVTVPGFWDPRRRPERPDTSRISRIRFLTEFDYPPFNYAGPDANPA